MKIIKIILISLVLLNILFGQNHPVEGYVLLENGNNPDNIKVTFNPTGGGGYFSYTNSSGYFYLSVPQGEYRGYIQKDGYYPEYLYNISIYAPTNLDTIILIEHRKVNPFIQPNDSTLAWYGSGDVDGDNDIDLDDYNLMASIQNDMSDLDGDGISSTAQDKQILSNYINGIIGYLPGQWNKLPTREERINWLDKMLAIDLTDTITYRSFDDYPNNFFVCGDFSAQTYINFHGYKFENQDEMDSVSTKYIVDQNGRFNIPLYYHAINAHANNAVLVGENPLDLYDWAFPDQQNNDPINDLFFIGDNFNPPPNSNMGIAKLHDAFKSNNSGLWSFRVYSLITFCSDSTGVFSIYFLNSKLLLSRSTVRVEDEKNLSFPYGINLEQNFPNPFNPNTIIRYILPKDENITIKIYDIKGKELETILNKRQFAGEHNVNWNGSNYPSGVYFYQLTTPSFSKTKKMIYLK